MKSATSFTRSGTSDWLVQRVSAVVLAVYTLVVFGFIVCHSGMDYATWHGFMTATPMRVFTTLALFSFVGHAWVGLWTVTTDYLTSRQMGAKADGLRLVLQLAMAVALAVVVVWGLQVIWGN